jgi:hypothetical protein
LATCQIEKKEKRKKKNVIFWRPSKRDCSIMPIIFLNVEIWQLWHFFPKNILDELYWIIFLVPCGKFSPKTKK